MKIKPALEKQIRKLGHAVSDSYENDWQQVPPPCRYFDAFIGGDKKALKASCAKCRAERMTTFDNALADVDCYTLMVIDFLKACGVEVEDES